MKLSARFEEAFVYASRMHAGQTKGKITEGNEVPYIAHVMAVAALVLQYGGDETQAIGALLHDVVEEGGDLEEIEACFGEEVAGIVKDCTDPVDDTDVPWRERKEAYVAHIPKISKSAFLVSVADKLSNSRTLFEDYMRNGESIWKNYQGGREGRLWYYRALLDAYIKIAKTPIVEKFEVSVWVLEKETEFRKPKN